MRLFSVWFTQNVSKIAMYKVLLRVLFIMKNKLL